MKSINNETFSLIEENVRKNDQNNMDLTNIKDNTGAQKAILRKTFNEIDKIKTYNKLKDDEDQNCDNETINSFTNYEERCAFISNCDYNYINLLYISYCNLNGKLWIAIPVVLIFLFLSFYFSMH